ncbi:MAG: helix-turn-helix transcriptional regulator [Bdellovibrionales bacterium]|nr:helix-turn-helix transcriptional regulator [Bdellovibrionales bacterium]
MSNNDYDRILKRFGLKLREIRNKKGWTLEETESHGWTSWRHLQKIEAGKNINLATLFRLSKLYKIKASELLEGL